MYSEFPFQVDKEKSFFLYNDKLSHYISAVQEKQLDIYRRVKFLFVPWCLRLTESAQDLKPAVLIQCIWVSFSVCVIRTHCPRYSYVFRNMVNTWLKFPSPRPASHASFSSSSSSASSHCLSVSAFPSLRSSVFSH